MFSLVIYTKDDDNTIAHDNTIAQDITQWAGAILSSSLSTQCWRLFFSLHSFWHIDFFSCRVEQPSVFTTLLVLMQPQQSCGWELITTHSCPQFCRLKKNSNSIQFIELYFWGLKQIKPLPRKSSSLSPSLRLQAPANQCWSSGNHSWRLFEKTIEEFDCKINGQALEAALQHSLDCLDGRAQKQGVPGSVAVAAGSDRLAWGKRATTLAILTQF